MKTIKNYTYTFSKNNKPALYVNPKEEVKFITLDCFSGQVKKNLDTVFKHDREKTNPATGPLYINGAKKGDVLVVKIKKINIAKKGVVTTVENCGPLWKVSGPRTRIINIKDGNASFNNHSWTVKPMIGVIGTASNLDYGTGYVFNGGGNMDNNTIIEKTTVYLPVRVDGGLLSIGDLHASMGDGEVVGTGIEINGEVIVEVDLIKNFKLNWPINETKDAYYINASGKTVDKAIENGYKELHRLIKVSYGFDDGDASLYMTMRAIISVNQACLSPLGGGNSIRIGMPKEKGFKLI